MIQHYKWNRETDEVTPCEFWEYIDWYNEDAIRVDETYVGLSRISTVFLGIGVVVPGSHKVMSLFETMVFGGQLSGHTMRCDNPGEARQNHKDVCELVRKELQRDNRLNHITTQILSREVKDE